MLIDVGTFMRVFYISSVARRKRKHADVRARHWVVSDDPSFAPRGPFRRRRRARKVLEALRHTEAYMAVQREAALVRTPR